MRPSGRSIFFVEAILPLQMRYRCSFSWMLEYSYPFTGAPFDTLPQDHTMPFEYFADYWKRMIGVRM